MWLLPWTKDVVLCMCYDGVCVYVMMMMCAQSSPPHSPTSDTNLAAILAGEKSGAPPTKTHTHTQERERVRMCDRERVRALGHCVFNRCVLVTTWFAVI